MYQVMMKLARLSAVLGGVVLTALVVLTCLSIAGRLLNGVLHSDLIEGIAPGLAAWGIGIGIGPINGDFELVESGVAFAIFAFIPICQITAGHASVDILTNAFPPVVTRFLRMVIEVVFAAVLILIAVQLFSGLLSKKSYGETTFLLQFPIWWAYAASFMGAVVAAIVGVYMAGVRIAECATGRIIVTDGTEAGA